MMDDDPDDDLAAAFFAQQAAKEAQKTALPKKDWVRRIMHETAGEIDAEKWLVTTLPHAQLESEDTKGIDGIILNRDSCCLEKKNDISKDEYYDNEEMRDKIKQLMLQKIQNFNLQKLDADEKEERIEDSDTICTG